MSGDLSDPDPSQGDGRGDSERLRVLFLDVTGTEEVVETQARETTRREVPPDWTDSEQVSEYVTEMAVADGLADTFGDPTDALSE
ncbi:hypothetical protein [Salinirussus salinus]|uniref:hypothetical protein n=1 Tax=Salinirussus salinus TaxID=1198300 RepID=UPI00135C699C|nr:hypothetical protein [Salinirussus salinus]